MPSFSHRYHSAGLMVIKINAESPGQPPTARHSLSVGEEGGGGGGVVRLEPPLLGS